MGGYQSHFPARFICKPHFPSPKSHSHCRIQKKTLVLHSRLLCSTSLKLRLLTRTQQRLKHLRLFSKMFSVNDDTLLSHCPKTCKQRVYRYKSVIFSPLHNYHPCLQEICNPTCQFLLLSVWPDGSCSLLFHERKSTVHLFFKVSVSKTLSLTCLLLGDSHLNQAALHFRFELFLRL